MLYYLTTGKYPFGTSKKDINKSITHDPIEPMKLNKNIPKKLNDIILKCLKKNMTQRYQSIAELQRDSAILYNEHL